MTKPTYLTLDTLDDRRELHRLLHRLPPARRLGFLEECCRAATRPDGTGPRPTPDTHRMVADAARCGRGDDRLTNTVYMDLIALAANWGLDLARAAAALEHLAGGRHADLRPSLADFLRA